MPLGTFWIVKVPSALDPVATPPRAYSALPTRVDVVGAVSEIVPLTVKVGPDGAGVGAGVGLGVVTGVGAVDSLDSHAVSINADTTASAGRKRPRTSIIWISNGD